MMKCDEQTLKELPAQFGRSAEPMTETEHRFELNTCSAAFLVMIRRIRARQFSLESRRDFQG